MTTAWLNNGSLVTENGAAILCEDCPCDEGSGSGPDLGTPCAVCSSVRTVYFWLSYWQSSPFGCLTVPSCKTGDIYSTQGRIGSMPWGAEGTHTLVGSAGCFTVTIETVCTPAFDDELGHHPAQFNATYTVVGGGSTSGPQSIGSVGDCLPVTCQPNADGFVIYSSTVDPTSGIPTPDGGLRSTNYLFSITETLAGMPTTYTATLTFSPNANNPFAIFDCFVWTGCFASCVLGTSTQVYLLYGDLGDGHNWWRLFAIEGSLRSIYEGAAFPTFGNSNDDFLVCGTAGVHPPWSIT